MKFSNTIWDEIFQYDLRWNFEVEIPSRCREHRNLVDRALLWLDGISPGLGSFYQYTTESAKITQKSTHICASLDYLHYCDSRVIVIILIILTILIILIMHLKKHEKLRICKNNQNNLKQACKSFVYLQLCRRR